MTNYRKVNDVIVQVTALRIRSKLMYPETNSVWKDIDQTVRGLRAIEGKPDIDDEIEDAMDELEDSVVQLEDVFGAAKDNENGMRAHRLIDLIFNV